MIFDELWAETLFPQLKKIGWALLSVLIQRRVARYCSIIASTATATWDASPARPATKYFIISTTDCIPVRSEILSLTKIPRPRAQSPTSLTVLECNSYWYPLRNSIKLLIKIFSEVYSRGYWLESIRVLNFRTYSILKINLYSNLDILFCFDYHILIRNG